MAPSSMNLKHKGIQVPIQQPWHYSDKNVEIVKLGVLCAFAD
jgi:hypothetical protein